MSILFLENHDSFSFNLIDYFKQICPVIQIRDHLETPDLTNTSHLVIGPGPGTPKTSGKLMQWLEAGIQANLPILGICLGHQAIGEYFGAKLNRAPMPIHGETHPIRHSAQRLFRNIPNPTHVTRYHSLSLSQLPETLLLDAWCEDGSVMAVSHASKPIYGLQFHPESFLSEKGFEMLVNFIQSTDESGVEAVHKDKMEPPKDDSLEPVHLEMPSRF